MEVALWTLIAMHLATITALAVVIRGLRREVDRMRVEIDEFRKALWSALHQIRTGLESALDQCRAALRDVHFVEQKASD